MPIAIPSLRLIAGGAVLIAFLTLFLLWKAADRRADKFQRQLIECSQGRKADREAYEAAQREAERRNRAKVNEIERQQEQITDETTRDLNARLERLRRELRDKAAGSAPGRSGSPAVPATPQGTDAAPRVCLTPEELLRAAENEERHDQLITWLEKQLGIKR